MDPKWRKTPWGEIHRLADSGDVEAQQALREFGEEWREMDKQRDAKRAEQMRELEQIQEAGEQLALEREQREKLMVRLTAVACGAAVIAVVVAIVVALTA